MSTTTPELSTIMVTHTILPTYAYYTTNYIVKEIYNTPYLSI